MATVTANKTFYGKYIEVNLPDADGKPSFTTFHPRGYGFTIGGSINFGDSGTAAQNSVVISNVAPEHQQLFKRNDSIIVKAGPKDMFALLAQGTITQVGREIIDAGDKSMEILFTEGPSIKNDKIYSDYNGTKTVKHTYKTSEGRTIPYTKKVRKKVNIAFRKGVKASAIIDRISRQAKIPLSYIHLKKDHVFKKGYTLSAKPETALRSLAKQCGSKFYLRRGEYVIDDYENPNPFNEHIYISPTTGLIGRPEFSDDGDSKTMTLLTYLDPRISAGSVLDVEDPETKINGLYRVKSGTHNLDDFTTQSEVYL